MRSRVGWQPAPWALRGRSATSTAQMSRSERIEEKLRAALEASHVEVEDDSARHAGHAGAAAGGGHFNVVVVSTRFAGMNRVARHRAVRHK